MRDDKLGSQAVRSGFFRAGDLLSSNWDVIFEEIRRKVWDAIKDDVQEHGIRVIRNSVDTDKKYGKQLVIILQPPEEG